MMADQPIDLNERRERNKRRKLSAAWADVLSTGRDGTPEPTIANAVSILVRDERWTGIIAFDAFSHEVVTLKSPPWHEDDAPQTIEQAATWTELDDVRLAAWFQRLWSMRLSVQAARSAVEVAARSAELHPVRAYLASLKWDGEPRMRSLASRYLGVKSCPYAELVSQMFLLAAVARVESPGCKVDTMLVLEGPQGVGKSTAVRLLFGDAWTSDTPPDLTSKDRFVGLRGRWCVEIAELDSFDRAETNRVKSFLSSPVDDFRPPYGRGTVRVPRQCVFVGTVNGDTYLRDHTGNRRFWPVRVGTIDLDGLKRDRDQLWAEALAAFHEGAVWWPDRGEVQSFEGEQAARMQVDEWRARVEVYAAGKDFVTVGEVLSRELGIEPGKWTQADQNRVSRALLASGRERMQRRVNSVRVWGYAVTSSDRPVTEPVTEERQ